MNVVFLKSTIPSMFNALSLCSSWVSAAYWLITPLTQHLIRFTPQPESGGILSPPKDELE